MYTFPQHALPRVVIHREMEVSSTAQRYEGEPCAPNEDDDDD